jgi:hypothetical protein
MVLRRQSTRDALHVEEGTDQTLQEEAQGNKTNVAWKNLVLCELVY